MPTPPDIAIEVFGKTDVGLIREHNEDNFLVANVTAAVRAADGRPPFTFNLGEKGALLLVCDGMGGAAAGEVAAQMAADAIYEALTSANGQPRDGFARLLRRAVQRANERIFIQSRDNQSERGMGTTCTAAGLVDDTLVIAQIGDSRCYVLRDGKLAQVTKDQSLAWQRIEAGAMTADEAKAFEHANIILQALGVQENVEVVLSQVHLRKGDVALLCSDGLHGPDTITVALARFDGEALKAPAPEETISFLGYDPGSDPVPEPMGTLDDSNVGRETVEERLPNGLLGAEDEVPTKTDAATDPGVPGGPGRPGGLRARRTEAAPAPRGVPSLLALFLIGLVAAAAGGIFVMKCERDQSTRSDGRVTLP